MTSHSPLIQSQSLHYTIKIMPPEHLADSIAYDIPVAQFCSQCSPRSSSHLRAFVVAILFTRHILSPRYLSDAHSHFLQSLLEGHLIREVFLLREDHPNQSLSERMTLINPYQRGQP